MRLSAGSANALNLALSDSLAACICPHDIFTIELFTYIYLHEITRCGVLRWRTYIRIRSGTLYGLHIYGPIVCVYEPATAITASVSARMNVQYGLESGFSRDVAARRKAINV